MDILIINQIVKGSSLVHFRIVTVLLDVDWISYNTVCPRTWRKYSVVTKLHFLLYLCGPALAKKLWSAVRIYTNLFFVFQNASATFQSRVYAKFKS